MSGWMTVILTLMMTVFEMIVMDTFGSSSYTGKQEIYKYTSIPRTIRPYFIIFEYTASSAAGMSMQPI
jgi:hypothetical protein